MKKTILLLALVAILISGCTKIVDDVISAVIVDENNPPVFADVVLLNGRPGERYLTVTARYIVDLRYRPADDRGPWTGIVDPDGDDIEVLSVKAWMMLFGKKVEDAVYFPPFDGGVHAAWRAGEGSYIEPAFVLYPGAGIWKVDDLLVCPYPEIGYAIKPLSWYPLRSGEGCYSTYHEPTTYIVEVVATDGKDIVTHEYRLIMSASWGGNQNCG